jgi:hypothetical protein
MCNGILQSIVIHHIVFRVLLKRISAILTAPPKITDKEYQEKKRLIVPNTKGMSHIVVDTNSSVRLVVIQFHFRLSTTV